MPRVLHRTIAGSMVENDLKRNESIVCFNRERMRHVSAIFARNVHACGVA